MQPDMNQMMQQAKKMQQQILKMQEDLAKTPVEGSAGGGAVTVTCTGAMEFTAIKIKPEAVDPSDIDTLEDLVLTAIQDATKKAHEKAQSMTSGLGLPPGLGF
ncbi:MAG: YbaB/EbfC family nucleoid-associated protein [Candidatus Obscuribacterales bacterium]|jgi:DNA-binding YbaB/EbfC family protein|nr:YbaB/EbfC family nucleoid-associated protein [Candidatus Obscuribacterales bacterium]